MEQNVVTLFLNFFWKNSKKKKKQQKPKKYVIDIFASLATSFSMHLVVNALFFKKIKVQKKKEKKSKFTKRPNMKRKKLKDQIIFRLLDHQVYLETK